MTLAITSVATCSVDGCSNPIHQTERKTYKLCKAHLSQRMEGRKRSPSPAAPVDAPSMLPPPPSVPPVDIDERPRLLLVIDVDLSRAQAYEVVLASPARAVVPEEPTAYAKFIALAEQAGYTVAIAR